MKLKSLFAIVCMISGVLFADVPKENAAPIVNVVFENSSNKLESVFSLANIGEYLGSKNVAVYRPNFLAHNGQIKQDKVVFDPEVYSKGISFYPFMFTYKGSFYYLFFSKFKKESKFPFFGTVIRIASVSEKNRSSKVETITNIDFNQNDTIVILLDKDEMKFYNYTNKTRFTVLPKESKPARPQPTPPSRPMPMPRNNRPQPAVPRAKPERRPAGPVQQAPPVPLRTR